MLLFLIFPIFSSLPSTGSILETIFRIFLNSIPLLLAEKKIHDDLKTILIYLHLDGQPVDITRWNQEDAFKPVFKKNENGFWTLSLTSRALISLLGFFLSTVW